MRFSHDTPLRDRLMVRSRPAPSGCREWTGGKSSKGYGRLKYRGTILIASRAVWEIERGPIPPDIVVMHKCDNPSCIEIEHLSIGTKQDNNRDMVQKGRQSVGIQNGQSRLTPWRVRVLRRAYRSGEWSYERIAKKVGLSFGTVWSAVTGRTWQHVPDHLKDQDHD